MPFVRKPDSSSDGAVPTRTPGAARDALRTRAAAAAWIAFALLPLAIYAAPSVDFMLPGYESVLGENYQPLRALRFYASRGHEYHKYGAMPNLVLLPVYGPTLAFWKLTGSFSQPSSDFPYGLRDPLAQLTFLIRAGRLEFMAIGLGLHAFLLVSLPAIGVGRTAVVTAFLVGVGTNHSAAHFLANTRPDGLAFAFVAASLGVYARILVHGPTPARAIGLSLLAVSAISCKELAGPLYVLPYLGLGAYLHRRSAGDPAGRARFRRSAWAAAWSGVVSYLLVNVVVDPAAWWRRMSHWLGGTGTSQDVWRRGGGDALNPALRAVETFEGFLNTLGPGGLPLTILALGALAWWRPRFGGLLLLPFASITSLGLLPLGFPGDRFYTLATVGLVPPLALGFHALFTRARGSRAAPLLGVVVAAALAANLGFGSWAWIQLEALPDRVLERSLAAERPRFQGTINVLALHPRVPGKSRLEQAGHRLDPRSLAQLLDSAPASRPDRIYVQLGVLRFIDDALETPRRAAFLASQGLDLGSWQGIEALGYRLRETVLTPTPRWFPFDWMPTVRWTAERSPLLVYERDLP